MEHGGERAESGRDWLVTQRAGINRAVSAWATRLVYGLFAVRVTAVRRP